MAFTDGVTEERDPSGQLYGEDRLAALAAVPSDAAQELLSRIETSVRDFRAETEPSDDVTLLAVRRR